MASIDQDIFFRDNQKNRCGGGYLEFNKTKATTGTERHKQETEYVSSTKESEVVPPTVKNFLSLTCRDYDIVENTMHYFQVNHIYEKSKNKIAPPDKNRNRTELNFMVDLKTLTHKSSFDVKLLQLRTNLQNNPEKQASKDFSSVFSKLTERFGLFSAIPKIWTPKTWRNNC